MQDSDLIEILHSRPVARARFLFGELLERYFRLRVKGAQHLPRSGRAIILPNHSGFAGFDAVVLAHYLRKTLRRAPKLVAHRAYFDLFQSLRLISESLGLTKPRLAAVQAELERDKLLVLFPEAEAGNFKSSLHRYRLRHFHAGFVRLALLTGAPVVPCLVIGAEESNFNLGNVDLSRLVEHLVIPFPVNVFPLPAKWTIEFLPPIDLSAYGAAQAGDQQLVSTLAEKIRQDMQAALHERLAKRRAVYW
jgi:1-acyl-sn-glycerol-3-phosphate acyltransferase